MTKRDHPLKGEFDMAAARWERTVRADGTPAALEIGYADNGLVALRMADDPDGDVLIYTPVEWEAFVGGVQDGEFDIASWENEPVVGSQTERQMLGDDGRATADLPPE